MRFIKIKFQRINLNQVAGYSPFYAKDRCFIVFNLNASCGESGEDNQIYIQLTSEELEECLKNLDNLCDSNYHNII